MFSPTAALLADFLSGIVCSLTSAWRTRMYIWILIDEGDVPNRQICGHDDVGVSLVGAFFTRADALRTLAADIIGDECFEEITWELSQHNPGFFVRYGECRD